MKNQDNIEDYFKNNLYDFEESPDEEFWERVEPFIPVKKKRKIPILLIWILFAALGLYYLIGWNMDQNSKIQEIPQINIAERKPKTILQQSNSENSLTAEMELAKSNVSVKHLNKNQPKTNECIKIKEKIKDDLTKNTSYQIVDSQILLPVKTSPDFLVIEALSSSKTIPLLHSRYQNPIKVSSIIDSPKKEKRLEKNFFVGFHTFPLQQQTYYKEKEKFEPNTPKENRIVVPTWNFGINGGIVLDNQYVIQLEINQNYKYEPNRHLLYYELTEQDIAILSDGVPIGFDFTMDTYFDEVKGNLKLTSQTTDITPGTKQFIAVGSRWTSSTRASITGAYKFDIHTGLIMPKIGVSTVSTRIKPITSFVATEIIQMENGRRSSINEFNIETIQTSETEELRLHNIEGNLGLQAEFPIGKKQHWVLTAEVNYWFGLSALLENADTRLDRHMLVHGIGIYYLW